MQRALEVDDVALLLEAEEQPVVLALQQAQLEVLGLVRLLRRAGEALERPGQDRVHGGVGAALLVARHAARLELEHGRRDGQRARDAVQRGRHREQRRIVAVAPDPQILTREAQQLHH